MTTQYLTQRQYSTAKARLTRAINSGDHQKVIDTVSQQFAEWDNGSYAWPDDWHRWQRARMDAEVAIRVEGW